VETRPTVKASPSTLSQHQERPRASVDIHQEASAQEPTYEEIAAPLKDNELFYKNGKPKPPSTGRLPNRGLTSIERKRPGGRKKDRRRDRGRRSNVEVPKGFNSETPEKTHKGDELTQPLNPTRNRSSELPIQLKASLPEEPGTEIGAACFGPHTALLLQDPLNHDTYDSGKALSQPIGEIEHGDIILAEKKGTDGRSKFFLTKVICVMLFEIPQDEDPDANKILQEKTLSKGLGLTLTKHHHIRKHGSIHEQLPGRWRFTKPANNSDWRAAADLDAADQE